MHECQEIRSANINQKEDRFLIYERDLINYYFYNFAFRFSHLSCVINSMPYIDIHKQAGSQFKHLT